MEGQGNSKDTGPSKPAAPVTVDQIKSDKITQVSFDVLHLLINPLVSF